MKVNDYADLSLTPEQIAAKEHRAAVGGLWDELGKLQFSFLVAQGLRPEHTLLDIGCGSFRGGVHFINYLRPGNYFGIDANEDLTRAGYREEVEAAGLGPRLPRENILVDSHFAFERFARTFDFALALSVFTHLPLNHIRLCLRRLEPRMRPGCRFYATFFECPGGNAWEAPLVHEPGGVTTYPDQDPYHYGLDDLRWCASGLAWRLELIGKWNHPRDQRMLCFHRT